MTREKVLEVLAIYRKKLDSMGIAPRKDNGVHTPIHRTEHLRWMIDEMTLMCCFPEVNIPKVMRWLGFLQGALWCYDAYTINEMRDHNRPTNEAFIPLEAE